MQHLETCLLIAGAHRVLCRLVMFFTVFSHWMYKMKYSCYQDSSVMTGLFIGFLVENSAACRSYWKFDFGCCRF